MEIPLTSNFKFIFYNNIVLNVCKAKRKENYFKRFNTVLSSFKIITNNKFNTLLPHCNFSQQTTIITKGKLKCY